MLDDKKIEQIKQRVTRYISEEIITTKEKASFVNFFLEHSNNFLN